jgi:hypothetical protein
MMSWYQGLFDIEKGAGTNMAPLGSVKDFQAAATRMLGQL